MWHVFVSPQKNVIPPGSRWFRQLRGTKIRTILFLVQADASRHRDVAVQIRRGNHENPVQQAQHYARYVTQFVSRARKATKFTCKRFQRHNESLQTQPSCNSGNSHIFHCSGLTLREIVTLKWTFSNKEDLSTKARTLRGMQQVSNVRSIARTSVKAPETR